MEFKKCVHYFYYNGQNVSVYSYMCPISVHCGHRNTDKKRRSRLIVFSISLLHYFFLFNSFQTSFHFFVRKIMLFYIKVSRRSEERRVGKTLRYDLWLAQQKDTDGEK